jgi:hypothetical protein
MTMSLHAHQGARCTEVAWLAKNSPKATNGSKSEIVTMQQNQIPAACIIKNLVKL